MYAVQPGWPERNLRCQTRSLSAPPCGKCGGDEPCRGGGGRRPRKARSCVRSVADTLLRCIKCTALRKNTQSQKKEKHRCILCNNYPSPMSDPLYEMSVFSKVVAAGSLSAAGRDLGVSTAVISRRLAALEARLGVRLVNRTTRRLALTDEGASYHDACTRILGEIEAADAAAAARRVEPQGVLKVALPASFGHKHI